MTLQMNGGLVVLIVLLVLIGLIGIGVGLYFILRPEDTGPPEDTCGCTINMTGCTCCVGCPTGGVPEKPPSDQCPITGPNQPCQQIQLFGRTITIYPFVDQPILMNNYIGGDGGYLGAVSGLGTRIGVRDPRENFSYQNKTLTLRGTPVGLNYIGEDLKNPIIDTGGVEDYPFPVNFGLEIIFDGRNIFFIEASSAQTGIVSMMVLYTNDWTTTVPVTVDYIGNPDVLANVGKIGDL